HGGCFINILNSTDEVLIEFLKYNFFRANTKILKNVIKLQLKKNPIIKKKLKYIPIIWIIHELLKENIYFPYLEKYITRDHVQAEYTYEELFHCYSLEY